MKLTLDRQDVEHSNGLEISVRGFRGDLPEEMAGASQVFVEVYEGKLRVHVWDGKEDPCVSAIIEPLFLTPTGAGGEWY